MNLAYVKHALRTALRIARFETGAVQYFDQSYEGFYRSFVCILICVPFYAIIFGAERKVAMAVAAEVPELALTLPSLDGAGAVFLESFLYIANWLALPLAMIGIVRLLAVAERYVPFVVAYNWSNCVVLAITATPYAFYLAGVLPLTLVAVFYYPIAIFALVYRWRIARETLGVPGLTAAGIVILDVVLGLLIGILAAPLRMDTVAAA